MVTVEQLLDKVAAALIVSNCVDPSVVRQSQETIRNGLITRGRSNTEPILLRQRDSETNEGDDLEALQNICDGWTTDTINTIECTATGTYGDCQIGCIGSDGIPHDLTGFLTNIIEDATGTTILNPLNVSQFAGVSQNATYINPELATQVLDTEIYELLGVDPARQNRIDAFFAEFEALTNPPPNFQILDGMVGDEFSSNDYHWNNDITAPQENDQQSTLPESEGMITRLNFDANVANQGKTLQSLRDTLNDYLVDVDELPRTPQDDRPLYQNQSDGYLKFRELNQGIIVRNRNDKFIEGLDPNNPTWTDTGFTITMWVRFIDKVSSGTLFNYGNPLKENNPFGFTLETYVLNKNDVIGTSGWGGVITDDMTWGDVFSNESVIPSTDWAEGVPPIEGFFSDTDSERFIRLVVKEPSDMENSLGLPNSNYEHNGLRGSHIGMPFWNRRDELPEFGKGDGAVGYDSRLGLMTNLRIPYDPNEWYFICATYSPNQQEDNSHDSAIYDSSTPTVTFPNGNVFGNQYIGRFPEFWRHNFDPYLEVTPVEGGPTQDGNGGYSSKTEYGAKCKVEIISRTDLLRARGYKV